MLVPGSTVRSTTVIVVRKDGQVVMAGDGQVTMGETIVKQQAKKIRRLYHDKILTGFAGSTADAFTLFERLEAKLEQFNGSLKRAAVELAKDWRMDRALAQARSTACCGRCQRFFHTERYRGRYRTRRRICGSRLGSALRACRRACSGPPYGPFGPPDRRGSHEYRSVDLHLYEQGICDRGALIDATNPYTG